MKILILSTTSSGLTQRVFTELELLGHTVEQHYDLEPVSLRRQVDVFKPQIILCPCLTEKIPEDIWREYLCLIVHPGIEGTRGVASLDWAISEGAEHWGVTLLQAADEMGAGDIWGTRSFTLREASNISIYQREVTEAAVDLVKQALKDYNNSDFKARWQDEHPSAVQTRSRPVMKQKDRAIDWYQHTSEQVIARINAAESTSGVRAVIEGHTVYLYGAVAETERTGAPGEILAIHNGAYCCATVDGAVWIRQLKCKQIDGLAPLKLPAAQVLAKIYPTLQIELWQKVAFDVATDAVEDIRVQNLGKIAYVYFDFCHGAMNSEQCQKLQQKLVTVKQSSAKMIVLMGGEDAWSYGIDLNCIEASDCPATESWHNISAINDLVMEIMGTPNQITIAALRNNASAGGAIMALACDEVVIREGTVLNPHYKTMGLYGSEYWTYLLPKHVGSATAQKIMNECQPMLASEAMNNGMVDVMLPEDWYSYHRSLFDYCETLFHAVDFKSFLAFKVKEFEAANATKPFAEYRREELEHMHETFYNLGSEYHEKRRDFVYGVKKDKTVANVGLSA